MESRQAGRKEVRQDGRTQGRQEGGNGRPEDKKAERQDGKK